jgi:hypothetical protein
MSPLLALVWLAAAPAAAQGLSLGPSPDLWASPRGGKEDLEPEPVAQALDLAFGPEVWAKVKTSTMGPVVDLTRLVRAGFFKQELIDLVVICAEAGRPLGQAAQRRRKGAALADIAREYGVDYDRAHEAALAVEETVDRELLPRFPEKIPRRKRSRSWRQGPD